MAASDHITKTTRFYSQHHYEHNLIIIDTNKEIQNIELGTFNKSKITFGTHSDNDIVLESAIVSRRHGVIERIDGKCYLYDTDSLNGTYVNGKKIQPSTPGEIYAVELTDGAAIRIDSDDLSLPHTKGVIFIYSVYKPNGEWKRLDIYNQPRITIGRDIHNDIRLNNTSVSNTHAVIESVGNGLFRLTDNNSTNGIIVNGYTINKHHPLNEKDVICIANSKIIYSAGMLLYIEGAKGVNLSVNNLSRVVSEKGRDKTILDNVSLDIKRNTFVAIIGGSGAGKSTMMNALCGFEKATNGEVLVNDIHLYDNYNALKNLIGYVPQQDIIYDGLKLKKMLEYTAKMRMPGDSSPEEIQAQIHKVLEMVDLVSEKDTLIRKLSGGQRKRASIAVELLADPNLFFLDEPTSGLDPGTEESLMQTLSKLSHEQGKTIIMVTHTIQNIHLCDNVIVMGRGGKLCYYGEPGGLMQFFETQQLTTIYNLINTDSARWQSSFLQNKAEKPESKTSSNPVNKKDNYSGASQLGVLCRRYFALIAEDKVRLFLLLMQPVIIGILLAVGIGDGAYITFEGTQSTLFALSCACIWIGLFNAIQEICKERNILKREYLANLKLKMYLLSKLLILGFVGFVQSLLFMAVVTIFIGLPETGYLFTHAFFDYFLIVFFTVYSSTVLGLVVSSLAKTGSQAMTVTPFILMFKLLFSGILFKLDGFANIVSYLTISRWSVGLFGMAADLNEIPLNIQSILPFYQRTILQEYERTLNNVTAAYGMLILFVIVFSVISVLVLRNVAKDSR
jgi:ABC-type multidrug transport system ATPase subunit